MRGRTIIPGLIDAHDHLASHGYALATRLGLDEPASTAHLRTARVLADTLAMGYTTVRDGGGLDAGFKVAIEQGLIPGPRLVLGIQIVSPTGGIGDRVSPSGHTCCAVYDPLLPNSVANGPDEVRDVVRTMVRAGADVIKTATTGGASSRPGHGPLDAAFSLAEMQALVTESHALGRRVMCHALGGPGLAPHSWPASIRSSTAATSTRTRDLRRMAGQGTFFVPTLLVYVYHRESASPHVRARAHALQPHHVASIQRALELGVPIAAGTDAGGHGHPKNAGELQCLVDAGLTPMQALRAGTQWAAQCLALEREVGTLEKGRLADLVVVHGNPLDDIKVLLDPARIELVLKGGVVCADRRKPLRREAPFSVRGGDVSARPFGPYGSGCLFSDPPRIAPGSRPRRTAARQSPGPCDTSRTCA